MSSCRDSERYQCGNEPSYPITVNSNGVNSISHSIEHTYTLEAATTLYPIKTKRTFSISGGTQMARNVYWVGQTSCEGLATPPCLQWCYDEDWTCSGSVSEDCEIIKDTIYFMRNRDNTLFYKHEEERLVFNIGGGECTEFRDKWGMNRHTKMKLKNAVIVGLEQFILIMNGERIILSNIAYTKEPSWMMGPIGIPTTGNGVVFPTNCEEYDHSIQQIFVFPLPVSKAIPWDEEIRCLGFYDYGYEQPGVVPALVENDGGKDFFYPSWIRESMIYDPFWAEVRDQRYQVVWEHREPYGKTSYSVPLATHDLVPKGNAAVSIKHGQMFGFTFQDRDGVAHSVAQLNKLDPSDAIIGLEVKPVGSSWAYHPISVI